MKRQTTEEHVAAMCAQLVSQRDSINRQIKALRDVLGQPSTAGNGDLLLVLYLSTGNAYKVVEFADANGWRLPGKKADVRRLTAKDVYALIRGEPGCVIPAPLDADLLAMARKRLDGRGEASSRRGWS